MEQLLAVKAHGCEKGICFKSGKIHPEDIWNKKKFYLWKPDIIPCEKETLLFRCHHPSKMFTAETDSEEDI